MASWRSCCGVASFWAEHNVSPLAKYTPSVGLLIGREFRQGDFKSCGLIGIVLGLCWCGDHILVDHRR